MIPSDHFVRFYNEVFKFLNRQGEEHLKDYWREIGRHQELHCLELFREKGLQGMYDYWEHIRIEENCDLEMNLFADHVEMHMLKCPSLTKAIDNDGGCFERYCDHCPGWIEHVISAAGYWFVYDLIARDTPRCDSYIFKEKAAAEAKLRQLRQEGKQLLFSNF